MPDRPDHQIFVEREGGAFIAFIAPPIAGEEYRAAFDTHKSARSYAGGLRMCHRFPIVDLTQIGGEA